MSAVNPFLESVKHALGISGTYQDATLTIYIEDVVGFLTDSGIPVSAIPAGLVARGVTDVWNYGSGDGKLSEYFYRRAAQLKLKRR